MNLNSKHPQTKSVWRAEWERALIPYFPKNKFTLECGCGPAYYRNLFGTNYVGIDIQQQFPKGSAYVRASVTDLPFREASFKCVLASALFEHIENPHRALMEICRVLEKKGHVVLGTPSRYGAKYETLKTFRGYDVEDLELLAQSQNLLIKKRFKVGRTFAIIFAEIENIFRRNFHVVQKELPSYEGEAYYNLFGISLLGRMFLKLREIVIDLVVFVDSHFPFAALYQGACVLATKCGANNDL